MKVSFRLIGLGGLVIFGLMCFVTFLSPITFERAGKSLIQRQVEVRVKNALEVFASSLSEKANRHFSRLNEAEIAGIRQMLHNRLPETLAAVLSEMQDLGCECRKQTAQSIRNSLVSRVMSLEDAQPQLKALIQGKYIEVVKSLLLDLRIFSGTNFFAFLLLFAISFLKPAAMTHLFLPGTLLLIATLVSAYFYLFQQNWFFTIISNDYVGWTYVAYLSVVFLFLCDILFNKARVTTGILNGFFSAIGHAGSLTPC